jgi:hypothetical protein
MTPAGIVSEEIAMLPRIKSRVARKDGKAKMKQVNDKRPMGPNA